MSDSSPDILSPEKKRAIEVVQDVMRRRREGEIVTDADVLRANPTLLRPLGELLERASAVAFLADEVTESPWANLMDKLDDDLISEDSATAISDTAQLPPEQPPAESKTAPEQSKATEDEQHATRITFYEEDHIILGTQLLDSNYEAMATVEIPSQDAAAPKKAIGKQTIAIHGVPLQAAAVRFRPKQRPPMALLKLRDDHQVDGEVERLRQDVTVIGRNQGEITVPHDFQMSGRHASISRELHEGEYRWMLRDLDSRNGVFVRIRNLRLKDQDLLLIANRLVQFTDRRPTGPCQLQEILEGKLSDCLQLQDAEEYRIGRDAAVCAELLGQEPQLDAIHVRLTCDEQGRWCIFNSDTVNGVWVRVQEIQLIHRAGFQLGEQRFVFEIP